MDDIIQALKDGDIAKLQVLSGEETWANEQEEREEEETEYDDDDEVCQNIVTTFLYSKKFIALSPLVGIWIRLIRISQSNVAQKILIWVAGKFFQVSHNYVDIATRWLDGLIDNNSSITKEVYSIHNVEFDRQVH